MSVFDYIIRDNPAGTFKLSFGSTTLNDISGSGSTLVSTTNLVYNSPLISGSNGSAKVGGPNTFYVTPDRFVAGRERTAFTLEAWVKFNTFTGNVSVMSHDAKYDGLYSDGNNIIFKMNFLNTGSVICSWPLPDFTEVYHIVGVYSTNRIQLFINGVLVDQKSLTDAQVFDAFAATPNARLYSGQSVSNNERISIDAPTYYNFSLSPTLIAVHFRKSQEVINYRTNVANFGGIVWGFTDADRKIALERTWDTEEEWGRGIYTDVSITDGTLAPNENASRISIAGNWQGRLEVAATELTSLGGVKCLWDGDGNFTVQASLNAGASWITLINGQLIPGTNLFNTTGKMVDIKIVFAGGVATDISQVRRLKMVAYTDSFVNSPIDASRKVTTYGVASTSEEDNQPIEKNDVAGLLMASNGYAVMGSDTSGDVKSHQTIEVWIKLNTLSAGALAIVDARSSGDTTAALLTYDGSTSKFTNLNVLQMYINGVLTGSGIFTPAVGTWYHIIIVEQAAKITPVFINSIYTGPGVALDLQLGQFAIYPAALAQADVTTIYNSYFKMPIATIDDLNALTIVENVLPYNIYSFDWSITGGGG